ncbi:MAG: trigger factor family protein, partial [Acholeplasmatales bacterium]|nr:trigger factor family protein [Acholeplasmatales bacterium]
MEIIREKKYTFVKFEISAAEWSSSIDKAFEIVKKDISSKGFRKGHVPRSVYDKQYGVQSLYDKALEILADEKYSLMFEDGSVEIFSTVDFEGPKNIEDLENPNGFSFSFKVENMPEVVLGEYKGLVVNKQDNSVSEHDIEHSLYHLVEKDVVEQPKEGENVLLEN